MNVTIRFGNPFFVTIYTVASLMIGWAIGARWGHSATAEYALFWAFIALLIHDIVMAILAGIGGYKIAVLLRTKDKK